MDLFTEQVTYFRSSVLPVALKSKALTEDEVKNMFSWANFCDEAEGLGDFDTSLDVSTVSHARSLFLHLCNNVQLARSTISLARKLLEEKQGYVDVDARLAGEERISQRRLLLKLAEKDGQGTVRTLLGKTPDRDPKKRAQAILTLYAASRESHGCASKADKAWTECAKIDECRIALLECCSSWLESQPKDFEATFICCKSFQRRLLDLCQTLFDNGTRGNEAASLWKSVISHLPSSSVLCEDVVWKQNLFLKNICRT